MVLHGLWYSSLRAFRAFVRKRTRPLSIEEAEEKRLFWAKCYLISSLLLFATATSATYKSGINFNYDTNLPKEEAVVRKLYGQTKDNVLVYRPFGGGSTLYTLKQGDKKEEQEVNAVKQSS